MKVREYRNDCLTLKIILINFMDNLDRINHIKGELLGNYKSNFFNFVEKIFEKLAMGEIFELEPSKKIKAINILKLIQCHFSSIDIKLVNGLVDFFSRNQSQELNFNQVFATIAPKNALE